MKCKKCGAEYGQSPYNWCDACVAGYKARVEALRPAAKAAERVGYQRSYYERNKERLRAKAEVYYYKVVKPCREARRIVEARKAGIVNQSAEIVNP